MPDPSIAGGRYAMANVQRYIAQVEASYDCSFAFWIDIVDVAPGHAVCRVHCTGAGRVYDLLPEGIQPPAVEVHDGEPFALGEALYFSVRWWVRLFERVREPIGPAPAL